MSDAPRKPPKLTPEPEANHPPEPEATRREFQAKPTEFERVNRPADSTPGNAPIDVQQLYRQANRPPPAKNAPPSQAPVPVPVPVANDVSAMLHANLQKANARGLNKVSLAPRRPSARKRDYWVLLIGGNLSMAGFVWVLGPNVITVMFGFGGMVFCSAALTWIMWFLMDDY